MVQKCVVKRCIFALSVTTCLAGMDLACARASEYLSDDQMKTKGVPLSRRYLSSPSKMSPFFERNLLPQSRSLAQLFQSGTQGRWLRSLASLSQQSQGLAQGTQGRRLRSLSSLSQQPQGLAQLFQSGTQGRWLRSLASLSQQSQGLTRLLQSGTQESGLRSLANRSPQPKGLARLLQSGTQESGLRSLANRSPQRKSLAVVFQSTIPTRTRLAFLEKKSLAYTTISPQDRASLLVLPKLPLLLPVIREKNERSTSISPSILPSVIRMSEPPKQSHAPSVSSVLLEPQRREEAHLSSSLTLPVRPSEPSQRKVVNSVLSIRSEIIRNPSIVPLSSPQSVLPSVIRLLEPSKQSHAPSVPLVVPASKKREEVHPPLPLIPPVEDLEGSGRGKNEVLILLPDSSQQPKVLPLLREGIDDPRSQAAVLRTKTLQKAEESMDGLTYGFYEISSQLFEDLKPEGIRLQKENLERLKKKSTEFKEYLYTLDPVVNEEFRSEEAKPRVNRLMSRLSDHLGCVEELGLRIHRLLRPRPTPIIPVMYLQTRELASDNNRVPLSPQLRTSILPGGQVKSVEDLRLRTPSSELNTSDTPLSSPETIRQKNTLHLALRLRGPLSELNTSDTPLASPEAITPKNTLHLVLRLRASSSASSTMTPLEEKLESAKEFIQDLQRKLGSIDTNLYGNHSEENLSSQQKELTRLMGKADEVESGLLRLKSTLLQVEGQNQVKTVLDLFDEVDCVWAQLSKRLSFLKSKVTSPKVEKTEDVSSDLSTDDSLDQQLEEDICALKSDGYSIDHDLYEDQRDPHPLVGHGSLSLNHQEKRLSSLQERARKIGERLMLISSQVTGEPHSSKRLKMSDLIGSFNDNISSLRQVQSRLNIIKSSASILSLETEAPFFSFIPNIGATGFPKILPLELSTDFTPEEELVSLEKARQTLKSDLLEFQENLFGEHAGESLKLHEASFLKLQETANELESRLMFLDSHLPREWQSPQRKQINELLYSFGDTLCLVHKAQGRLNFLKFPPSSPTVTLASGGGRAEGSPSEVFKSEEESLSQLYGGLSEIDKDLYGDHTEKNLTLQEEKLLQAKKTLKELEERLSVLDSQTSRDLQSNSREDLNALLGSLSKSQCFIREVEKRLAHLKSANFPKMPDPVVYLSENPMPTLKETSMPLKSEKTEESSSSLSTEDPVAEDLQKAGETLSELRYRRFNIEDSLYGNHTKENLTLQEQRLLGLEGNAREFDLHLSSLGSKIIKESPSQHRDKLNEMMHSFKESMCLHVIQTRIETLKK